MSSIFDLSGQTPKKKPPQPKPQPKSTVAISDMDVKEMLQKIKTMQEDLARKFEETEKKLGTDKTEIKEQIAILKIQAPESYESIQRRREELEMKILGVSQRELAQKKANKSAHSKRGKTLGARKRWIDMH